jgi:excisionase family DNA binding protein
MLPMHTTGEEMTMTAMPMTHTDHVLRDEPLFTVDEVAAMYRMERSTIIRRIKSGQLPAIRVGEDGPYRIYESDARRLAKPATPAA